MTMHSYSSQRREVPLWPCLTLKFCCEHYTAIAIFKTSFQYSILTFLKAEKVHHDHAWQSTSLWPSRRANGIVSRELNACAIQLWSHEQADVQALLSQWGLCLCFGYLSLSTVQIIKVHSVFCPMMLIRGSKIEILKVQQLFPVKHQEEWRKLVWWNKERWKFMLHTENCCQKEHNQMTSHHVALSKEAVVSQPNNMFWL